MKEKEYRRALVGLILIAVLTIIPFLGMQLYNTKGEPREAIVAYSMIHEGNWILPVNNGGDIAYKPPLFHWSIAAISKVTGCFNEYISRLPSAIGLIVMVIVGFVFYAKRKNTKIAFIAALLTLTSFEVHRAGFACRVDMLLTAFIVLSLYALYRWVERGCHSIPWFAVLLMSLGTLTKGPVGIVLPCMVIGVFILIRHCRWKPISMLVVSALLACILPAIWYWAAYQEGGSTFVNLIMDENFRRFTGKMSYVSHSNPFYYNFITIIAGWVPWTLLLLLSIFFLRKKVALGSCCIGNGIKGFFHGLVQKLRSVEPLQLFTWLSFLLILFFYCIPESKRSVYLLPVYPFMAVLIAEYIYWLSVHSARPIRITATVIAILAILLPIAFVAVKCGIIPDTSFHGKHALENIKMMRGLEDTSFFPFNWLFVFLPAMAGIYTLYLLRKGKHMVLAALFIAIFSIYLSLDAVYQPAVLNPKSDKPLATYIEKNLTQGKIYSYVSLDMLRFFIVDYYLGDKVGQFEKDLPQNGYLMVGQDDRIKLFQKYSNHYQFTPISHSLIRSADIRQIVWFYKFARFSTK